MKKSTFKKRLGVGEDKFKDGGMHEVEVVVSDFEKTTELLHSIRMVEKFYEENKCTKYVLNDVEFCIDEWPLIPTYLEIEGKNWDAVKDATSNLGLNWDNHIKCSTMQIYKHYNINENDYSFLTFEKQIKKGIIPKNRGLFCHFSPCGIWLEVLTFNYHD